VKDSFFVFLVDYMSVLRRLKGPEQGRWLAAEESEH
jgi:hypothetical protein